MQRRLLQEGPKLSDAQLLECFIAQQDESAFAVLVRRHGPMVFGVCRRVLRNYCDAEDAFQATFLVLVRKAPSIASRELLANWLYRVAYQTAVKARAVAGKRCRREMQVAEMPEPESRPQEHWSDLHFVLDQELSRLPNKYRVPIILCDLQGNSRKEAARQLGWSEGTLSGRLARAKQMLAGRLARRGLMLTAGTLTGLLALNAASANVPLLVAVSATKAATSLVTGESAAAGAISSKVAVLMEGVLKAMLMTKLKIVAVVLLATGLIALGGGLLTYQSVAAQQNKTEEPANKSKRDDTDAPKADATKIDKQRLQGIWKIVSMESDGTKISQNDLAAVPSEQTRIRIDGDKWISKATGKEETSSFRLDATKTPRTIDIKASDGKFEQLAIYQLEGDDLKICYCGVEKQERPTQFAAKRGSPTMLYVYKRVGTK